MLIETLDNATGVPGAVRSTGGAVPVTDQSQKTGALYNTDGTWPKSEVCTAYPQHRNDVPNYTGHPTLAACLTAEVEEVSFTAGQFVTGVRIACWGGASFKGGYVTVNQFDTAAAAIALSSSEGAALNRRWVPAGGAIVIRLASELTKVGIVAIDDDATPDNNFEIEPL